MPNFCKKIKVEKLKGAQTCCKPAVVNVDTMPHLSLL